MPSQQPPRPSPRLIGRKLRRVRAPPTRPPQISDPPPQPLALFSFQFAVSLQSPGSPWVFSVGGAEGGLPNTLSGGGGYDKSQCQLFQLGEVALSLWCVEKKEKEKAQRKLGGGGAGGRGRDGTQCRRYSGGFPAANLTLWDSDYQEDKRLRWALTVCGGFSQMTILLTVIFVFFWPPPREKTRETSLLGLVSYITSLRAESCVSVASLSARRFVFLETNSQFALVGK